MGSIHVVTQVDDDIAMRDETSVARLIRQEIRHLKAYHVPDARGLVKLDAMENPYAWPEELRPLWLERLRQVSVNRYPDPQARALRQRLRQQLKVPAGMELMLGNGSDELIQILALALAQPSATVLAPVPTFVMYQLIATAVGMRFIGVPLRADFMLDEPAMQAALQQQRPAVVFLSYPNNPTGNLFDPAAIVRVIESAPGLVVLDEAYHAFAGESFMDRLDRYDNLLVMRTLSKQGLAGLRLGILIGRKAWLDELDKIRLPYNINSLTQVSAEFALEHAAAFDDQARRIRDDREALYRALAALPGIEPYASRANFILFRVRDRSATTVFQALQAGGVLIKNLDSPGPLSGCLRVTVGAPAENEAFLSALRAALP